MSTPTPSYHGTIIVFAKCPIPGKSKTRLSSLLGQGGSALLAKAMLSDVLQSISKDANLSVCSKVLVYAPGTPDGHFQMSTILTELGLENSNLEARSSTSQWILLPMMSSAAKTERNPLSELLSSDLGSKLADALERVRELNPNDPVVFLGMDSPELLTNEIIDAILIASKENGKAYINPANDGGYGMLCIPSHAPLDIFSGVRWSSPLTAVSQMKALSDHGIDTIVGSLMDDIDEPDDVRSLAVRLNQQNMKEATDRGINEDAKLDRLRHCSMVGKIRKCKSHPQILSNTQELSQKRSACPKTFDALLKLGIIN